DDYIKYLGKITQVRALTAERYRFIAGKQAKLLKNQDFDIMIAIDRELRIKYIKPAHVAKLDPTSHQLIIKDLKENQVPWLVNEAQLMQLNDDSQILWMSSDQITRFSKELVHRLGTTQIKHIDPEAVSFLNEDKIPYLETIAQIRAV